MKRRILAKGKVCSRVIYAAEASTRFTVAQSEVVKAAFHKAFAE